MKQQGKTWLTPQGTQTLAKYLPAHEKLFEKFGQKIAATALDIERRLREEKATVLGLCKEALRNNPDAGVKRRHTFHTFDREFKIEYDIKEEYVRVYRATKSNPSLKDYELVNLDFNKSAFLPIQEIEVGLSSELKEVIESGLAHAERQREELDLNNLITDSAVMDPAEEKFDGMAKVVQPVPNMSSSYADAHNHCCHRQVEEQPLPQALDAFDFASEAEPEAT